MRPKDLPILFSWEERRPLLHEGMLCVPRYYQDHQEFAFSLKDFFGNDNPICVEFCSGNGEWIARAASVYPEYNWVGVEKQFKRARKVWAKKHNFALKNLLSVCGMAEDFCLHYVRDARIQKAYVNFPDPWPKNGHAKKRLIQTPFLDLLTNVCGTGSELTLVTDDEMYARQMVEVLGAHEKWIMRENRLLPEDYGSSYFNRLWQSLGKQIRYMRGEVV